MLGKLLKYEWVGFRFPFIVMLVVTLSTTVVTCGVILTVRPQNNNTEWYSVMAFMLSFLVYYFGLIGCTVGMILIIAIRFYKTSYTDQGYLTHTLPVSTQMILNAKIIAAVAFALATCLAMVLSFLVICSVGLNHVLVLSMADGPGKYTDIFEARRIFYGELSSWIRQFEDELGISLAAYTVYMIIWSIVGVVANVMMALGCVSIGQLYTKHRIVGAIGAYFAVQLALNVAYSFATVPMYIKMANDSPTIFGAMSSSLNMSLFFMVVMSVAMYFVNLNMMTRRLNLE